MGLNVDLNVLQNTKYKNQIAVNSNNDNPISVFSFDNIKINLAFSSCEENYAE